MDVQIIEKEIHLQAFPEDFSWGQAHRHLSLQTWGVEMTLTDGQGHLVFAASYTNTEGLATPLFIRYLQQGEEIWQQKVLHTHIWLTEPRFCLFPQAHSPERDPLYLARLMLDELILPEEVWLDDLEDPMLLSKKSPALWQSLELAFPGCQIHHQARNSISWALHLAQTTPDCLYVHLSGKRIQITACHSGKLQACQSFSYHSLLDVVYYLQLMRAQCFGEEREPAVFLTGELGLSHADLFSLRAQLPQVHMPGQLRAQGPEKLAETAWWKYVYLSHLA
ncbi:MAG: DUF3822 family protein [Bacteroidota bacterium]